MAPEELLEGVGMEDVEVEKWVAYTTTRGSDGRTLDQITTSSVSGVKPVKVRKPPGPHLGRPRTKGLGFIQIFEIFFNWSYLFLFYNYIYIATEQIITVMGSFYSANTYFWSKIISVLAAQAGEMESENQTSDNWNDSNPV